MSPQPDHATPPPNVLPPNPFASPRPSPQRPHASIDLTSAGSPSPGPIPIYEIDLLPAHTPSRLQHRPNNAERRRSVKEHAPRKLSDATRVPDPANGYQGPPAMKKPTAGRGYQPINTLNSNAIADRNNPTYGRKHTTYSKHDRNTKSIGLQRHSGQQAYLERNPHHSRSSHNSYSVSHAVPAKRRKVEHSVAEPVNTVEIEDSEEDEIQQTNSAPGNVSTPRACPTLSSQSPHSTGSKQSGTGSKPASVPVSEFANTDNLLIPKRTRPRRKNANMNDEAQRGFKVNVPSLSAGSLSRGHSAEVNGHEFENLEQDGTAKADRGVNGQPGDHHQLHRPTEGVTSRHFPSTKMRINESTEETYDRIASGLQQGLRSSGNLRDYRPADSHTSEIKGDPIEGSEDELAQPNTSKLRRKQSPSKTVQHYRTTSHAADKHYKLKYVRTFSSVPDRTDLVLRHTDNPRIFHITGTDVDGDEKTLHQLILNSINKAVADNTHRMRLTGPSAQGSVYWFDLEFELVHDFQQFRDGIIFPDLAKSNQIIKGSDHMKQIFERPLEKNDKIGQSSTKSGEPQSTQSYNEQQLQSQTPLLDDLMDKSRNTSSSTTSNRDDLRKPTARTQGRPVRTTRATASTSDQALPESEKEVEKFSRTRGLGKPWSSHLDFNIQESFLKRRRCTVNFDDLPKLDEEEYLNDSLVNFYLLYLYHELKVSIDRVYFFNTYFFDTLTKNTKKGDAINYDAVKSWTKRDDVFSYDHIVVPINEKFHWYLAIICNVSNIARKPAVEDHDEGSQDLDQKSTNFPTLEVTAVSEKDLSTEQHGETNGALPAQEHAGKDIEDDEENLFEEEKKLSLIDRNEENVDETQQRTNVRALPNEQMVQEVNATAALRSSQVDDSKSDLTSRQSKQLSKKKNMKHKPVAPKKDPNKPVIIVLDSLGSIHSNATRALREWLQAEGLEKRGMAVEIDNKGYYPKSAQIPMQNNFSDCGLYVLGYAKKFFDDPDEFKSRLLRGEMSSEADWPDMDASKMRADIRNLIVRLYDEQKEAHKAKKAAKAKDAPTSVTNVENKGTSIVVQRPNITKTKASATATPAAADEPQPVPAPSKFMTAPTRTPRFGSHFTSGTQSDENRSFAPLDVEKIEVSQAHSTVESPQKMIMEATPAHPSQSPMKRTKSPEVRVPLKSAHIDASSYLRFDGATDRSRPPPQPTTDLSSPLRKHGLHSINGGKLHTLSARKSLLASPSRPPPERPVPSSPPHSRTRSGSHDDPITLDDSQDLDAPLERHARTPNANSLEIIELDHSQDYIASPARHANVSTDSPRRNTNLRKIDRDSSIQEGVGYEWQEGRDISSALKASSMDEQERFAGQTTDEPNEQHDPVENVYHVPDVHSQSSHTLQGVPESQAMDVDGNDAVIPESPEPRRSSPGVGMEDMDWQSTPA